MDSIHPPDVVVFSDRLRTSSLDASSRGGDSIAIDDGMDVGEVNEIESLRFPDDPPPPSPLSSVPNTPMSLPDAPRHPYYVSSEEEDDDDDDNDDGNKRFSDINNLLAYPILEEANLAIPQPTTQSNANNNNNKEDIPFDERVKNGTDHPNDVNNSADDTGESAVLNSPATNTTRSSRISFIPTPKIKTAASMEDPMKEEKKVEDSASKRRERALQIMQERALLRRQRSYPYDDAIHDAIHDRQDENLHNNNVRHIHSDRKVHYKNRYSHYDQQQEQPEDERQQHLKQRQHEETTNDGPDDEINDNSNRQYHRSSTVFARASAATSRTMSLPDTLDFIPGPVSTTKQDANIITPNTSTTRTTAAMTSTGLTPIASITDSTTTSSPNTNDIDKFMMKNINYDVKTSSRNTMDNTKSNTSVSTPLPTTTRLPSSGEVRHHDEEVQSFGRNQLHQEQKQQQNTDDFGLFPLTSRRLQDELEDQLSPMQLPPRQQQQNRQQQEQDYLSPTVQKVEKEISILSSSKISSTHDNVVDEDMITVRADNLSPRNEKDEHQKIPEILEVPEDESPLRQMRKKPRQQQQRQQQQQDGQQDEDFLDDVLSVTSGGCAGPAPSEIEQRIDLTIEKNKELNNDGDQISAAIFAVADTISHVGAKVEDLVLGPANATAGIEESQLNQQIKYSEWRQRQKQMRQQQEQKEQLETNTDSNLGFDPVVKSQVVEVMKAQRNFQEQQEELGQLSERYKLRQQGQQHHDLRVASYSSNMSSTTTNNNGDANHPDDEGVKTDPNDVLLHGYDKIRQPDKDGHRYSHHKAKQEYIYHHDSLANDNIRYNIDKPEKDVHLQNSYRRETNDDVEDEIGMIPSSKLKEKSLGITSDNNILNYGIGSPQCDSVNDTTNNKHNVNNVKIDNRSEKNESYEFTSNDHNNEFSNVKEKAREKSFSVTTPDRGRKDRTEMIEEDFKDEEQEMYKFSPLAHSVPGSKSKNNQSDTQNQGKLPNREMLQYCFSLESEAENDGRRRLEHGQRIFNSSAGGGGAIATSSTSATSSDSNKNNDVKRAAEPFQHSTLESIPAERRIREEGRHDTFDRNEIVLSTTKPNSRGSIIESHSMMQGQKQNIHIGQGNKRIKNEEMEMYQDENESPVTTRSSNSSGLPTPPPPPQQTQTQKRQRSPLEIKHTEYVSNKVERHRVENHDRMVTRQSSHESPTTEDSGTNGSSYVIRNSSSSSGLPTPTAVLSEELQQQQHKQRPFPLEGTQLEKKKTAVPDSLWQPSLSNTDRHHSEVKVVSDARDIHHEDTFPKPPPTLRRISDIAQSLKSSDASSKALTLSQQEEYQRQFQPPQQPSLAQQKQNEDGETNNINQIIAKYKEQTISSLVQYDNNKVNAVDPASTNNADILSVSDMHSTPGRDAAKGGYLDEYETVDGGFSPRSTDSSSCINLPNFYDPREHGRNGNPSYAHPATTRYVGGTAMRSTADNTIKSSIMQDSNNNIMENFLPEPSLMKKYELRKQQQRQEQGMQLQQQQQQQQQQQELEHKQRQKQLQIQHMEQMREHQQLQMMQQQQIQQVKTAAPPSRGALRIAKIQMDGNSLFPQGIQKDKKGYESLNNPISSTSQQQQRFFHNDPSSISQSADKTQLESASDLSRGSRSNNKKMINNNNEVVVSDRSKMQQAQARLGVPILVKSIDNEHGIAKGDVMISLLDENSFKHPSNLAANSASGGGVDDESWSGRVREAIWRVRNMRREKFHQADQEQENSSGGSSRRKTSLPVDLDDCRVVGGIQNVSPTQDNAVEHLKCDEFNDALELYEDIIFNYYRFFEEALTKQDQFSSVNVAMELSNFKPYIGAALHNIGITHLLNGDHEEAFSFFKRATQNREECLGEGHPDHISSLVRMAICRFAQENFADAHTGLERALSLAKRTARTASDYCQLAEILNNLGCLSYMCGQPSKAMDLFSESLDAQDAVLNTTLYGRSRYAVHTASLNISVTRANVGFLSLLLKDITGGIKSLEAAVMGQRLLLKREHVTLISTMDHLAVANLLDGNNQKAIKMLLRILEAQQEAYGSNDPRCLVTKSKIVTIRNRHKEMNNQSNAVTSSGNSFNGSASEPSQQQQRLQQNHQQLQFHQNQQTQQVHQNQHLQQHHQSQSQQQQQQQQLQHQQQNFGNPEIVKRSSSFPSAAPEPGLVNRASSPILKQEHHEPPKGTPTGFLNVFKGIGMRKKKHNPNHAE